MEFDYYSPSETFVVLTADQFVGRDDGVSVYMRTWYNMYALFDFIFSML